MSASADADWASPSRAGTQVALLVSVFVVAACGLVYELIAAAAASYLLGDSVLQFSTVIGTYLFAMGVGSWLSRHLTRRLPDHFVRIELLVAAIGGFMPALLFVLHAFAPDGFRLVLYALIFVIGVLVGLEIPLVMRLLKQHYALKDLVSQVLTFDYLGALAVSLAFPIVLVPYLGMIRTGLFFGIANALVAIWAIWLFRDRLLGPAAHAAGALALLALLGGGFAKADALTELAEEGFYLHRIVHAESTPFQRIVITRGNDDLRLYLNRNLQFSSRDEHRYHEALVHPVLAAHPAPRQVLILGGGDGLAAREVLRHPGVERVTLVDLDPRMTELFSTMPMLTALNQGSLSDPRLDRVVADAFTWLEQTDRMFDIAIVDLPDPSSFALGKLYTNTFYALLARRVAASGFAAIQTTSPLYARKSFWSVVATLESAGWQAWPYHATVPSFGVWGYVAVGHRPFPMQAAVDRLASGLLTAKAPLRFLTPALLPTLFELPADMQRVPAEVNRLHDQSLVHTYEREWGRAPEH
ncbi:MAG: polyamine aminopropyltransferase [Lautropia sp.]